jgi:CubicO group peptidase (beta-lactamase class C family)
MKWLKVFGRGLALFLIAAVSYLWLAPPDLLRVASNYSAKMVCSNVFIAGRDAAEVLAVDVQAPGHPLLGYVSVDVSESEGTVEARLFGFIATATARYRTGLGCTNVHEARLSAASLTPRAPLPDALWPAGNTVALSQDPDVLAALDDAALLGEGARAIVVVQNGRIIGEAYGDGFAAETPLLGWSMAKTVTAGIIGTLIQSGDIDLSDTLVASYPAWAEDGRAQITVADMLGMTSGLTWNEGYGNVSDVTKMLYLRDDMSGFAATQASEAPPETVFNYSSGTTTMLARLWQDRVGAGALGYPGDALFGPLGMTSAIMETDARDTFVGSSYIYATARDWARYGQFLLQGGVWDGVQILPEGFTDWMVEPVMASDGAYAKGQLWFEPPGDVPPFEDAVWLRGHDGQALGIFPSHDLVIVRMGLTPSRVGYSPVPLAQALIAAIEG